MMRCPLDVYQVKIRCFHRHLLDTDYTTVYWVSIRCLLAHLHVNLDQFYLVSVRCLGEVVAQLVQCSPINLFACATLGSKPCHFVSLWKTLNSQCLPWAKQFYQYIIAIYVCGLYGMVPHQLFSMGFLHLHSICYQAND